MARQNDFKIKAIKMPNLCTSSSLVALSLLLLTIPPAHSNPTPDKTPNAKTDKPKVVSERTSNGDNIVSITTNDKAMAQKLGYDERVLALIQKTLKPTMGIIKSGGLDSDDDDFFQAPTNQEAPLLEEDRQTLEKIARDYPELKPLVKEAFDRLTRVQIANGDFFEAETKKQMGEEKYKRYLKFLNATKPYDPIIKQEMTRNLPPGHKSIAFLPPEIFESDEAVDKAIKDILKMVEGKELLPENRSTLQLALKFKMPAENANSPQEQLNNLQSELDALGYRLSVQDHHFLRDAKQYKTKDEAIAFLKASGTNIDSLSLDEQKARQYQAVYPQKKNEVPAKGADNAYFMLENIIARSPNIDKEAILKLAKDMGMDQAKVEKLLEREPDLELLPGATVKKLENNRWQVDVPARYTAKAEIKFATILKVPADSIGLELIRNAKTEAGNYSIDNAMIIAKLKYWNEKYGIKVLEANSDSFKIRFNKLPDDISELCTEMFLFCPELELSSNEQENATILRELANRLKETKVTSFWWD